MTEYNGFGSGTPSGLTWQSDGDTYTLGQKFRVDTAGLSVTKIRWYIPSGSPNATTTGIYVGLYEVGNTAPVATAGPVTCVLDAWNELAIAPFLLTSGADYIAAVLFPSGHYGVDTGIMPYDPPGPINFYTGGVFDSRTPPTLTYPGGNFGNPWYGIDVTVSDGAGGPQSIAIGRATETDLARTLGHKKSRAIGRSVETDLARTLSHKKSRAIGRTAELDLARVFVGRHGKLIGRPTETDLARALLHTKRRSIGRAVEVDLARPLLLQVPKIVAIGRATEHDTARAFVSTGLFVDTDWEVEMVGFESSLRSTLSNSYVYAAVRSEMDLRGDVVEMAFTDPVDSPADADWQTATWADDSTALVGVARTQVTELQLAPGHYMVWVRVTHPPIRPVLRAGLARIY